MKKNKMPKTKMFLGVLAAVFLAAEPLMMLWQPLLPPGSYAVIATVIAICRAALTYVMTTDVLDEETEEGIDDATKS